MRLEMTLEEAQVLRQVLSLSMAYIRGVDGLYDGGESQKMTKLENVFESLDQAISNQIDQILGIVKP